MDREFHYFMTHLIALSAGFKPDDAFTIACATRWAEETGMLFQSLLPGAAAVINVPPCLAV
jgi:hypothetical protein